MKAVPLLGTHFSDSQMLLEANAGHSKGYY